MTKLSFEGLSAGKRRSSVHRSVADLVTATSELAANSVMHGGGSGILRLWSEKRFARPRLIRRRGTWRSG